MIPLTPLESDILGDMAWDSHSVGEIIGFIRSANSWYSDVEIYQELIALLRSWVERGWLRVLEKPTYGVGLNDISELIPYLEHHGPDLVSLESDVPLPEIDLTDQAFEDVEWLRGAV